MKSNNEEWKDIEGYEGIYQISNYGNVKSLERDIIDKSGKKRHNKERILKHNIDKYGYVYYWLYNNGYKKCIKGHKLVAKYFLPNPYNLPIINHKDENKSNNNVDNLEWCTYEYNLNYGTRSKKYIKSVNMIDINTNLIVYFVPI